MVVAGGVAVVVMVAFVAGVGFGTRATPPLPGERLGVALTRVGEEPPRLSVLVPRCPEERVAAVEVRDGERAVWRIEADKASIDERYEIGADPPPLGFRTVVPLEQPPAGVLTASVELEGGVDPTDAVTFDVADVADAADGEGGDVLYLGRARLERDDFEARALSSARCGDDGGIGGTTALFAAGAAVAVAGYGVLVVRWWRGRRGGGGAG